MKKKMKKPVFLVMGGTLAFFSLANPMMAQEMKVHGAEKAEVNNANLKSDMDVRIKASTDKKEHDDEKGEMKASADGQNKVGGDKQERDDQKGDAKQKEDQKKPESDTKQLSISADAALITGISNTAVSGKGTITFTVPEGKSPLDLEFICYKQSGNGKVVHAKVKGKYTSGKHTVDLDLPKDSDKYDLEVTCQMSGDSRVVLWQREAGGEWKASANGSVNLSEQTVSAAALITGISNTAVSGKGTITFTVPEGKSPLDLEFICYKQSGNGKVVHAKVKGKYTLGKHTVDLDLPKDSDKYDLEVTCQMSGDTQVVLWQREAGGEWKASANGTAALTAVTLKKLLISSILIDKEAKKWSWHVKNPNMIAVSINWKLEGTDKSETRTIQAGEDVVLTTTVGESPKLQLSVQGEQGYDVAVSAAESSNDQSDSTSVSAGAGGSTSASSGDSTPGGSGASTTPAAGGSSSSAPEASSGGSVADTSSPSSSSSSPSSESTPSATSMPNSASTPANVSNSTLLAGEQTTVSPAAVTPATVTDMSRMNSPQTVSALNQPSAAQMNRLPQTGESAPYGAYSIGAILMLIGSYFLRKRKARP